MEYRRKFKKCCYVGTYEHQKTITINGRKQGIDFCIADIVEALNVAGISTEASCCGHGIGNGSVILKDGRVLFVKYKFDTKDFLRKEK